MKNLKVDKQKLLSGEMEVNESFARDFTTKYKKYFSKPGEGHYCLRRNQLALLEELKNIPNLYRPELLGN